MEKTIEHISLLAKLDFAPNAKLQIGKDFQRMLDFIDSIDEMSYPNLEIDMSKAVKIDDLRPDKIDKDRHNLNLGNNLENDYFVTYSNLNISELSKNEKD